jgi:hypothetical protein
MANVSRRAFLCGCLGWPVGTRAARPRIKSDLQYIDGTFHRDLIKLAQVWLNGQPVKYAMAASASEGWVDEVIFVEPRPVAGRTSFVFRSYGDVAITLYDHGFLF